MPRCHMPAVRHCVILGPTASGKSALAHAVARKTGTEILAVDSMTVYRGMDIGTAKPTAVDRQEVTYHCLDLVDPNQTFTVARWLELAERVLNRPGEEGSGLVLTGGTPLYFQSLFHGLFEGPAADAAFRSELAGIPTSQLHARLAKVDPAAAARIHANDRKRLTRALEVHRATGRGISEQQTQWGSMPRHDSIRFGLRWDREALNRRINARVKQMLAQGWLEEVRGLIERYGEFSPTASEATGYALLAQVVRGQLTLQEALERIKIRTRQLARRQMTWFRRFQNVNWINGDAPLDESVARIIKDWGL